MRLDQERRWVCPNCSDTSVTFTAPSVGEGVSEFHNCAGLHGLWAPFVAEGVRCKVEMREWEDYVGDELVTRDDADRPVSAVYTTRDDGQDCVAYAPCAQVRGR